MFVVIEVLVVVSLIERIITIKQICGEYFPFVVCFYLCLQKLFLLEAAEEHLPFEYVQIHLISKSS